MARVVTTETLDAAGVAAALAPRDGFVAERPAGDGRFEAEAGPVDHYVRDVRVEPLPGTDGLARVTQEIDFRLAIPYFAFLFVVPVKRLLARGGGHSGHTPWWAPPDRLDPRAARVLGLLAALSVIGGYLGTLVTQTTAFAADEFGSSNTEQGVALSIVRLNILGALPLVALADRRGRRLVLVTGAVAGSALAAAGALAPSLLGLAATQVVAKAFATGLVIAISIVVAEEMPANSRAYGVATLGLAGGLGAGFCVMALPLADVAAEGWRLLYVLPLAALPLAARVARAVPESRRFTATSAPRAPMSPDARRRRRFWLLAVSALLLQVFVRPASEFQVRFLEDERNYSAAAISAFIILTNTPAVIGVVVGGRLADTRGRRKVGAVALAGGTLLTVLMYLSAGWPLWAWSLAGGIIGSAALPALGVYGAELFPTALRGRSNGLLTIVAGVGSVAGLLAAGALSEAIGSLGPALAVLSVGPALLAVLVLVAFPETAHLELEDINPEDKV